MSGAASPEQADHLVKQLKDPKQWWPDYPVTTTAMNVPTFDPKGFWRGVTIWSMIVHNVYGVQEDYRTVVVPPRSVQKLDYNRMR